MIFTILIAFVSLIGLIILHELGHFILAKKFGVRVEEFGIGLPPRLFGKKIGETLYSLNLIPFGAFVKIHGEEGGIESAHSFSGKPIWQRALIVLGGVVSFWIISAILLSIVFGIGVSQIISDEENHNLINPRVQIVDIATGSPAEAAGLKIYDTVRQFQISNFPPQEDEVRPIPLGGKFQISKVKELQELTERYKGEEVILTIERGKEISDIRLIPRVSPPEGEGLMGVALVRIAEKSYSWYLAPFKGIEATLISTKTLTIGLGNVFENLILGRGLPPGAEIMGPVGIASLMAQVARMGINYYLQFIAIISIYLAIFNILPIPALDGGKLLFLGIEAVRKKPIPQKIEQNINSVFFVLLLTLMIWVTIKDITRLF